MEKPKSVKRTIGNVLNKKILGSAITFLLIGVLLGSFISYSTTPSSTLYLSGGIYPGAPTYTIFTDGSYYYAKDAYGFIDYSSSNFSYVINTAMTSIPVNPSNGRGSVYIAPGNYSVYNTITPPTGLDIYGSNIVGTALRWNGALNGTMISFVSSGAGSLRNMEINCMNSSNGIYVNGGWAHHFEDLSIYHPYGFGLYVTGTDNDYYESVKVAQLNPATTEYGIEIDGSTAMQLINCWATGTNGLLVQYSINFKIHGGEWEQTVLAQSENVFAWGMDIESAWHDRAVIISSYSFGDLGPYTLIGNCFASDIGNTASPFRAVRIDSATTNVLLEGNWFLDQSALSVMDKDFEITDTASYVTVLYNRMHINSWVVGGSTSNITIVGNSPP
jgi:hypothetical protein